MIGDSTQIHRIKQHLGKVQDIAFSANSQFLATLGGQDDNTLIIWDTQSGEAICGSPAAPDSSLCCRWLHGRNDRIVTGKLPTLFYGCLSTVRRHFPPTGSSSRLKWLSESSDSISKHPCPE